MPFSANLSYGPREELSRAVVEGENSLSGLIGKKILGDLPITRRNAHYIKSTLSNGLQLRSLANAKYVRAPGTHFQRVSAKLDDGNLNVTLRGVEKVVPMEHKLDYAGYFDLLSFYARQIGSDMTAITKEQLIAAAIFNTTNFGAAVSAAQSYTAANASYSAFTGGTGLSFIADMIAATRRLKAAGEAPDYVAVMSGPVFERVRQAFTVLAYSNGQLQAQQQATQSMIEGALSEYGIKSILVGDGYVNTADQGATPSLSQIWSNTYIWVGRPGASAAASNTEGVGVSTISGVGANVYWEGYDDGGIPNVSEETKTYEGGNYVEIYPQKDIESEIIRVKMSDTPIITNPRAGTLIATGYV